jgi:hypothetical protein
VNACIVSRLSEAMNVDDEEALKAPPPRRDGPPDVGRRRRWSARSRNLGLAVSATVAVVAAVLHFATFVTTVGPSRALIAGLALSSLACFGVMLSASGFGQATRKRALTRYPRASDVVTSGVAERVAGVRKAPRAATVGFIGLAFYFGITFLLFLAGTIEGSPVERNGEFQLQNHGRFIRTLDRDEFRRLQNIEVRGMSGHFVMFSLAAAIGFAFLVETQNQDAS